MHVLLFLPALLLNLNYHFGIVKTILSFLFLVVMQVMLGLEWIHQSLVELTSSAAYRDTPSYAPSVPFQKVVSSFNGVRRIKKQSLA